jgi:hypothetical protein
VAGAPIGLLSYEPDSAWTDRAVGGAARGALAGGVVGGLTGPFNVHLPHSIEKLDDVGNKILEGQSTYAVVATKRGKLEGYWKHPDTGEEFFEKSKAFTNLSKAVDLARKQGEHSILVVDQGKTAYFVEVAKIPTDVKVTPALMKQVGERAGKLTWVPDTPEWAPLIAKQSGWTHDPATGRFYLIDTANTSELPSMPIATKKIPFKKTAIGAGLLGLGAQYAPEELKEPARQVLGPAKGLMDLLP